MGGEAGVASGGRTAVATPGRLGRMAKLAFIDENTLSSLVTFETVKSREVGVNSRGAVV